MQIKIEGMALRNIDYRTLKPLQGNLKILSEINYRKLKKSFEEKGLFVPMFVWKNGPEMFLLDGHGRDRLFQHEKPVFITADGKETHEVPCLVVHAKDLKDAKEKLLIVTSQFQTMNPEGFDEFTFDLDDQWLKDTVHFDKFDFAIETPKEGLTDPDDVPEAPREPITKPGDLWILGNHRLLCGSSLDPVAVDILLGKENINFVFTDPPYGVSYAGKNTFLNSIDKGNRIQKEIENDQMDEKEIQVFWKTAFEIIRDRLAPVNSYYICGPQIQGMMMMMMMMQAGLPYRHVIIWVKNNHVLGRCDYNYKHEPIFFGWSTKHAFYGHGPMKTSVWEVDKPLKNDLHPTMKPVALVENSMLNSSQQGDVCFDGFLGSGTTMIAAEKIGRRCFGLEIDPAYCDVIVKRWEQFTNKKGERIENAGQESRL